MEQTAGSRWYVPRAIDGVWLVLFAALAVVSPHPNEAEYELLALLALFQLVEPRVPCFRTRHGSMIAAGFKLIAAYLLVGVTGAINSSYYLLLLFPVVAAVNSGGAWALAAVSALSCAAYLSFLLFLDWSRYDLPPDEARELGLRVLLFVILVVLMNEVASAARLRARQYMQTAAELAVANRNLAAAQDAARRSERLAAIGQLMAGLAHELRNPLGTIKASAEVLVKNLQPGQKVAVELAGYIRDEVDRTNSLVSRFLDFARPLEIRLQPADLNEVMDRAIAALQRHQPPFQLVIHRNYSPDIPLIPGDAELLERVFFNLLLNAAQASPAGGAVTVKTRPLDGAMVEAAVIDRGSGIDPVQIENVFNPFFTTKPGGTGLGLAIVSKIVDGHGGRVLVESEPGQGSIFRVLLPRKT